MLFRVIDSHTELSPDKENVFVRAELVFEDDDEDTDPEEIVEWAAFGFLFTLAALSFHDARPRGISELDFRRLPSARLRNWRSGKRLALTYLW